MWHWLSDPENREWFDIGAVISAIVSGFSLIQAAHVLAVAGGMVSLLLGCIRVHDRIKYGPSHKGYRE